MNYQTATIVAGAFLLTGCVGAFVPMQTVEQTGIKIEEASSKISIITPQRASAMQKLGEVVGYSCKNKIWDAAATAEDATYQVKIAAAQRGATAIADLNCQEGGFSVITNCWQSYTCKAVSLR